MNRALVISATFTGGRDIRCSHETEFKRVFLAATFFCISFFKSMHPIRAKKQEGSLPSLSTCFYLSSCEETHIMLRTKADG